MIKKYCSCVRAVQNNGKHRKEIDKFVREITDGKYYAQKSYASKVMLIIDTRTNLVVQGCELGEYIVAVDGSKYEIISPKVFESLFEECK